MSGSMMIFYGAVVTPVDASTWKALPRCLFCVGSTGNIDWMLEYIQENKLHEALSQKGYSLDDVVILQDGEFVIPGFIDTHTHAPQYPNLGRGGQYQLLDWLKNVTFPKESQFEDKDFAQEVYSSVVRRSLDCGTTTSCYYATIHLEATKVLADIVNRLGQRAFIGKCNMDCKEENPDYYTEEDAQTSLQETSALISYIRTLSPISSHASIGTAPEPLLQAILTPRFAISCTSELLKGISDLADKYDSKGPYSSDPRMRIQTHISENRGEIQRTRELFPEAKSYTDVYDRHGILRETTILAHAVHLTDDEIRMVKERNAGISHCPTSNFNLCSGVAPIGKYLDKGIKVGLGTDVSGGFAVSMLNAIQHASIASKIIAMNAVAPGNSAKQRFAGTQFSIQTLFYLATLGGAEVCNLGHRIGSFSPGKSFDALWVSVLDAKGSTGVWGKEATSDGAIDVRTQKLEENLERFLFCGDDRNILRVYVQGCLVGGQSFEKKD
ncbi:hypothetical protein AGABI1DRAFT_68112 [Agaricus bisporus var. burnettii JB137-S8]|uniref:Guanine deaminase n=1 Tax=Agaricus bisporus var. burnettii (strain JB137-S8 / ATCC MYA-4627 / FGSC 10392) TaxID=597362 RepID=K5W6K9_AGABU|nr:uncharacterized protein AGABI1DRAFT_68112 [Agaricus bisporus var. burnettii JB137-S8]EKM82469.1 hypothetical protein AGABI1DRAFT_68112 [Agaricus bisporus var. burnettii JB137-S8]